MGKTDYTYLDNLIQQKSTLGIVPKPNNKEVSIKNSNEVNFSKDLQQMAKSINRNLEKVLGYGRGIEHLISPQLRTMTTRKNGFFTFKTEYESPEEYIKRIRRTICSIFKNKDKQKLAWIVTAYAIYKRARAFYELGAKSIFDFKTSTPNFWQQLSNFIKSHKTGKGMMGECLTQAEFVVGMASHLSNGTIKGAVFGASSHAMPILELKYKKKNVLVGLTDRGMAIYKGIYLSDFAVILRTINYPSNCKYAAAPTPTLHFYNPKTHKFINVLALGIYNDMKSVNPHIASLTAGTATGLYNSLFNRNGLLQQNKYGFPNKVEINMNSQGRSVSLAKVSRNDCLQLTFFQGRRGYPKRT